MMWSASAANSSGRPRRWGKGTCLAERDANRIGQGGEQRRLEDAGRDGHDADPQLREIARDRQRHADDAALRGRVGGLADLAVEGRDRGGIDDDTPRSPSAVGVFLAMMAATSRMQLKVPMRFTWMTRVNSSSLAGPALPKVFIGGADAGAVDEHVDAAQAIGGGLESRADLVGAGDVGRREHRLRPPWPSRRPHPEAGRSSSATRPRRQRGVRRSSARAPRLRRSRRLSRCLVSMGSSSAAF